jgi:8-amino-7-oxononanoate synthase
MTATSTEPRTPRIREALSRPAAPSETWAQETLASLERQGLLRELEPLQSAQGPVIHLGRGRFLNFSSNDYLGLAADPALSAAARTAAMSFGLGAGASRLIVGDTAAHHALEEALGRFFGSEAALLFNSGYAANVGVLSTLAGDGDVIFSDALNHASIVDGCRLSRASTVVYPHRDVAALDALLEHHRGRRRIVVTDAVFSMDGDRAPLEELSAVCGRHGAALMVDEAHALGVLGPTGAGLCELTRVAADIRVGTLGKALGGFGAFALTSSLVRAWLINRARSLIFSTSLPASLCAAGQAALERVERDPTLRERLWRNIGLFAQGLQALGRPAHEDSAVFSVVLGDPQRALDASQKLRAKGVLAKPIRPPTVPHGTSRLRFSLSAAHTPEHIAQALEALHDL